MLQKITSDDFATTNPRGSARKRTTGPAAATAGKPASQFSYSEEEWLEIETAIQVLRKGALPKKVRKWLVGEARWYLAESGLPRDWWQSLWKKAASKTEDARQVICTIAERHLEVLNRPGYPKKRDRLFVNRLYDEDLRTLVRIRERAKEEAESDKWSSEAAHYDNPKFMYEFKVLLIWTELGGKLAISRHWKTQKIQGPLARFFRAATIPVMRDSAPSLESLPDIVCRQRRFLAFEATPEGKRALKRGFDIRQNHW
jgi:hypothetical protein